MKNVADIYPLAPIQEGMLFHTLFAPESGIYCEQFGMTFTAPIDVAALQAAWTHIIARHAILRTAFVWEGVAEPVQIVRQQVKLPWTELDWRELAPEAQEDHLRSWLERDSAAGFTLTRAPLLRLTFIWLSHERAHLIWTYHHILLDGASHGTLLSEVFACFDALVNGEQPTLPPVRPYRDYIAWLKEQDLATAEAFWRQRLADFSTPTPLLVPQRADGETPGRGEHEHTLSADLTARLSVAARQHQVTLNTLVQGAWSLLLSRYGDTTDVVFGMTASTRPPLLSDTDRMVGLFINTLPLRVTLPPEATVGTWLRGIQAEQIEARQYDYCPLVQIQGWSGVSRGQPLFESILVFENYAVANDGAGATGLAGATKFWWAPEQPVYPLSLTVAPRAELTLRLNYDPQRFSAAAIVRLGEHLEHALTAISDAQGHLLRDLDILVPDERQRVLVAWNDTATANPDNANFCALFMAQVARTPDAIAVAAPEGQLTYAALDARTDYLARCLRQHGAGPETLVGVCLPRSLDLVSALLGIMKAGAAYLPLDAAYPAARLAFMLTDSGAPLVLTTTTLRPIIARALDDEQRCTVITIDTLDIDFVDQDMPLEAPSPDLLAYVIYTSGSTGQPKGVEVTQRGIGNLAHVQIAAFDVTPESRVLQFASPSFDAAVSELAMALLSGATLCVADDATLHTPPSLLDLLQREAITVVTLPPSVVAALPVVSLPALRALVVAGEACRPEWLRPWLKDGRRVCNAYGPTEATVCATITTWDGMGALTAGRPIANTQIYLLDRQMHAVPIGVPGEIFIGGVGLARGYRRRPQLTTERFIAHPFSNDPQARLYRTGDLGRYLPDGDLVFLGRADMQIKLRGYRIELGEIEAALCEHPAVQACVVTLWPPEQAQQSIRECRLVAYVLPQSADAATGHDYYTFLRDRLPTYMIPATFIPIDALPLTPNGKLDRAALPDPDAQGGAVPESYVAPRNPIETTLAEIWTDVLGIPMISVTADFFEIGGHSLLATQITSRAREAFQLDLPLQAIFTAPTIADLAQAIVLQTLAEAENDALAEALDAIAPMENAPAIIAPTMHHQEDWSH